MHTSEELKKIIQERTTFIVNDCYTFIMARSQSPNTLDEWHTGGGNFLMAIGLFAVLNFLSKIYRHLTHPQAFITEEDRQRVIDIKKVLQNDHPDIKQIIKKWPNPRTGEIDETQTFIKFMEELPHSIDMGLSQEITAVLIWRTFRNYLTHMAWPNSAISTFNFRQPPIILTNALEAIENDERKAFYKEYGIISCNSDKLAIALTKIADWLCEEINANNFSKGNIVSTLKWIKR